MHLIVPNPDKPDPKRERKRRPRPARPGAVSDWQLGVSAACVYEGVEHSFDLIALVVELLM